MFAFLKCSSLDIDITQNTTLILDQNISSGDTFLVPRFVPGDQFLVLTFLPGDMFLVTRFVPGDHFLVTRFVPGDTFLVTTITRNMDKT